VKPAKPKKAKAKKAAAEAPAAAPAPTPAEPAAEATAPAAEAPVEAPAAEPSTDTAPVTGHRVKQAGLGGFKVIAPSGEVIGQGWPTYAEALAEAERLDAL
jgi:hypothetical protein